ncbi:GGDEF domain-containing protein [Colwellia psychrerythraea]|uniref:diguanylate cyclase n=1 Tax=Colwellia psychrerythraea TaxID=28229 RepID=A0A099KM46_COLPS|nr:GGDEF domain-containing protein [Colwellia psychrerythraea]KGJ90683.1 diguanylate cyclase [Colwellia psychrerythraea]
MFDLNALLTQKCSTESTLTESMLKQINCQIANQLNTGVLVVDAGFNIVLWNRFLQVHTDNIVDNIIGQSIFSAFPELPERWLSRKLTSVLQLNTPSFCSWEQRHHLFELPHTRPITTDSEFMAQNCTFLPIIIENNSKHICILIEDVTDVCHYQGQLQKALDEVAQLSRIDGLTQIYNRRHWQESLAQEYAKARRHDKKLSLIMLDLDYFKLLNDNYGHQCGDMVLIEVSALISSLLRVEDLFGRYGGEEFAIILPETNLAGAKELAQRICDKIATTLLNYNAEIIKVTVSLGVTQLNGAEANYEELITKADEALYQAKALGRNQVCSAICAKTLVID